MDELLERMRSGGRVTVMTGAGISAGSGVPTFRGAGGLWRAHRAADLATPQAFARDPELVWEWYAWRRETIASSEPNAGHRVLADWGRRFPSLTLITQNVDGLHERAGSTGCLRFHGSIWELRCWEGCPEAPPGWWDERVPLPELPPRCPHCAGLARPGVVWFGEAIDPKVLQRAAAALDCAVFLAVGTSSVVQPAAGLLLEAGRRGAYTVEINPEATAATAAVDVALAGPAESVLPEIDSRLTT